MKSVRIFYDGMSSEELRACLERQTPDMRGHCYRNLTFVTDDSYQHAIFLNGGMTVSTPADQNACFLMEPPEKFRPQPHPAIGTLFSFNSDDTTLFGERCVHRHMDSFLHTSIPERTTSRIPKTKRMSMVVSGKADTPYQQQRLALARALLATDLPIDFFGRDLAVQASDPRIRGPLPRLEKRAALEPYWYSIACENSPQDGYLTEKFLDCIVHHCIPLTNNRTARHFPDGCYRFLDPTYPLQDQVQCIADMLAADLPAHAHDALEQASAMVLGGDWCLATAIADFVNACPPCPTHPRSRPIVSPRRVQAQQTHAPKDSTVHQNITHQDTAAMTTTSAENAPPMLSVLFLSCRRMHYLVRTLDSIRSHMRTIEPTITVAYHCFDNGSSTEDRLRLVDMGFDILTLSKVNLGIGPAMNHLISQIRSPFMLNVQDDWAVMNDQNVPFVAESIRIMQTDEHIAHIKLDDCHFLDFKDRSIYSGPFQVHQPGPPFFVQNPKMLWGGFCFPPAITRVAALRSLGPFREDRPFQRGWAESEYTQRYTSAFVAAKSPAMIVFKHIGVESTNGWTESHLKSTTTSPITIPNPRQPIVASSPVTVQASGSIVFIIPYQQDSPERAKNLAIVTAHLKRCIAEERWDASIAIATPEPDEPHFRKTVIVNRAVCSSTAGIIALIDADAVIPRQQLATAIAQLRDGADVVYPHEGSFFDVPRSDCDLVDGGSDCTDLILASKQYRNLNAVSVGGAVLVRRLVFWSSGGMNERFESWGREDVELHARFVCLGFTVARIPGPVFHLTHPRPPENGFYKPDNTANVIECDRVTALSRHALLDEIAQWPWAAAHVHA